MFVAEGRVGGKGPGRTSSGVVGRTTGESFCMIHGCFSPFSFNLVLCLFNSIMYRSFFLQKSMYGFGLRAQRKYRSFCYSSKKKN